MESLKIGLAHLNVRFNQPELNREELIRLNRQAAEAGAQIIVNPELAVSGYGFRSRDDIAPVAESWDGPIMQALAVVARDYGVYIIAGYAERDAATGIFYNSASAISPEGEMICRYRKNSAETRWACPGNPRESNTFETPWGRVGLLICSDTYYGALARMTALRGARLILVPANWPAGSLDPAELWQVRAYENGVYVAVCNRCGSDRTLDFQNAWSCVYAPAGDELLRDQSGDSGVFYADLPLINGQLFSLADERLRARTPDRYTSMYLDMRQAADITAYYNLPDPAGCLIAAAIMPPEQVFSAEALAPVIRSLGSDTEERLLVLPAGTAGSLEDAESILSKIARRFHVSLCAGFTNDENSGDCAILLSDASGRLLRHLPSATASGMDRLPIFDIAGARVLLARAEELMHPELTAAAAKLGCDIALSSTGRNLDRQSSRILASRSIDQLYIAAAGRKKALISEPPESHHRWGEASVSGSGCCTMKLDASRSRHKRFFDRYDFDLLLRRNHGTASGFF